MKKQIIVVLAMLLIPMLAFSVTVEIDGVEYAISSRRVDGARQLVAKITGISDELKQCAKIALVDSVEYNEEIVPVIGIENKAFMNCTKLENIRLPQSLTSVGAYAFSGCAALAEFSWPEAVTAISEGVFSDCTSLTEVNIPDSVEKIGELAFSGCTSLGSVKFPKSLKSIGNYLTSGYSGESEGAFLNCTGLAEVIIPEGMSVSLCAASFKGCTSLNRADLSGVTELGHGVFYDCENLSEVVMGNKITSIYGRAFVNCPKLTKGEIPASVTLLGNSPWSNCGITHIDVAADNRMFKSIDGVLFNKNGNMLWSYPDGKLGNSYVVPQQVDSLYMSAFSYASNLKTINLPDGIKDINEGTFFGCENLESVNLPNTLKNLEDNVFAYCTSLTEIFIPASIDSIAAPFGGGCVSLNRVNVAEENAKYTSIDGVLFTKDKTDMRYFPEGRGGEYTLPEGTLTFYFAGSTKLHKVILPTSITKLPDYCFCDCESLQTVEIPNTVTSIGGMAFGYCPSLQSLIFPESVTHAGGDSGMTPIFAFSSMKTLILQGKFESYKWMMESRWTSTAPGGGVFTEPGIPNGCVVYAHKSEFNAIRQYFDGDLRPLEDWDAAILAPMDDAVPEECTWYNLHGSKVSSPSTSGIYLRMTPDGSCSKVHL